MLAGPCLGLVAGVGRRGRVRLGVGRRVIVELTPLGLDLVTTVNAELHAWERALAPATDPSELLQVIDDLTLAIRDRAVLSRG